MDYARYDIGGQAYYQAPMGLLQTRLFIQELRGLTEGVTHPLGLMEALGDRVAQAMAILLIPDGLTRRQFVEVLQRPGGLEETSAHFEACLSPKQVLEILSDFFDCNQISLVLGEALRLLEVWNELTRTSSLNGSAPSPPADSRPVESPSSV